MYIIYAVSIYGDVSSRQTRHLTTDKDTGDQHQVIALIFFLPAMSLIARLIQLIKSKFLPIIILSHIYLTCEHLQTDRAAAAAAPLAGEEVCRMEKESEIERWREVDEEEEREREEVGTVSAKAPPLSANQTSQRPPTNRGRPRCRRSSYPRTYIYKELAERTARTIALLYTGGITLF